MSSHDPATLPGPGSQASLRQANEARVLDELASSGPITQAELARRTALAPSTVSGIVKVLAEQDLVDVDLGHGGRRGRSVRLARQAGVLVGVDVGHSHVAVGISLNGVEILSTRYRRLERDHTHGSVLRLARGLVTELLDDAGLQPSAARAAGLSLPAPINVANGRGVGFRQVLPGWADVDLVAVAESALGMSVSVDNDANAGALAEHRWGAGAGMTNIVYIKLGHGVGAGLVINGALYRGATGVSGEIGHTIIDERGSFCRCGNRGCLETLVNATHLVEQIHPARPDIETIDQLITGAIAGDPPCVRLLGDAARAVGLAAANLCNVFNPDALLIGGGLASAGALVLDPLRTTVVRYGVPSAVSHLVVEPAHFGARTHLMGALALASLVPSARQ